MENKSYNPEYIFFDLDGTLTDSQEGIIKSLKIGLEAVGISRTDDELRVYIGPPLYDTFMNGFHLSKEDAAIAVKAFRKYFGEKGLFENKPYQGIAEMLERVRKSGKRLIVATSKPENFAVRILEHFKLSDYFDFICGSLMDESRSHKAEVIAYALERCGFTNKEDIEKEVLMVGDRKNDVDGARQNGMKSCYVLYGYGNQEEAQNAGADFVVSTIDELGDFLCGNKEIPEN